MPQPHEVRWKDGTKINWNRPPKPNRICRWTKRTYTDRVIFGSFFTLCHMNRLNNLSLNRFGEELVIFQGPYSTHVPASAGTHDYDCCWDWYIPGVGWWTQQRFGRANGKACWYRYPPPFGNHIHGFSLPPHRGEGVNNDFKQAGLKVGKFLDGGVTLGLTGATSQIEDYYNHAKGLSGQHEPGSDRSWFPRDIPSTVFDLDAYVARRAA